MEIADVDEAELEHQQPLDMAARHQWTSTTVSITKRYKVLHPVTLLGRHCISSSVSCSRQPRHLNSLHQRALVSEVYLRELHVDHHLVLMLIRI